MMQKTLYSWLGSTDLRCFRENNLSNPGPLATAVLSGRFDVIKILSNWTDGEEESYSLWLKRLSPHPITTHWETVKLVSPIDFSSIYENVSRILESHRDREERTYHLSPGTPAMASIWIIVSSGEYPARLIESSLEQGLKDVSIPFQIKADFISKAISRMDKVDGHEHFEQIISSSTVMDGLKQKAAKIAPFDVSVLIYGESGTGKELMAGAIHKASGRKGQFIAVNCGAIPSELVESEFFGYKKGAFTGAEKDHEGYLLQADKGTLFLDEIGELPLSSQVKLLRSLNDCRIRPVGDTQERSVDIRVIAATNKDLYELVEHGEFREDLFHRLAVGILNLPPLRERGEDLKFLIQHLVKEINGQFSRTSGQDWTHRILPPESLKLLLSHQWSGNVRELRNTLTRLILWADKSEIQPEEVRSSLLISKRKDDEQELQGIPVDFDLQHYLDGEAAKWLTLAMKETGGNKSEAAKLLGFKYYQTLSNWLDRYEIS